MSVTITDVAKYAGVSIATVSRVINSNGTVNEALKQRVLDAIEALGYVPNSNAQALKQDCSRLIGITASDLSVAFFPELVKHVEKTFLPAGYSTIVSSTYDEPKNERMVLDHMLSRRVDVLLVNSTSQNEERLEQIQSAGIPLILYDRRSREHAFPSVYMDKKKAIYQAMEHLYGLGHRRIVLVTGPRGITSNYDRFMGIQKFIFDHELNPQDCQSFFGSFSREYGFTIMEELMQLEKRPTALITGSIAILAGVLRFCHQHGLSIPDDIALVSMGNFAYSDAVDMKLTYMDDCVEQLAEGITQLLHKVFSGGRLSAEDQIIIAPSLHIGTSTMGR